MTNPTPDQPRMSVPEAEAALAPLEAAVRGDRRAQQTGDRTALRDRVRRAICEAEGFAWDPDMLEPDEYGDVADAVLAVLPEPTDQTAVRAAALREAALHLYTALFPAVYNDLGQKAAEGVNRAVSELHRLADEQPTTPTTETLLTLVRDFLDPDPCSFDHHGYCQAHAAGFGGEPLSCPHGRARKLLAAPAKEA